MLKAQGQTGQAFHSWSGDGDRRGSKGTQVCSLTHLPCPSTSLRWENLLQQGLWDKANNEIETIPKSNQNEEGPVLKNSETSWKELEKDGDKDAMWWRTEYLME